MTVMLIVFINVYDIKIQRANIQSDVAKQTYRQNTGKVFTNPTLILVKSQTKDQ